MSRTCSPDCTGTCILCPFLEELFEEKPDPCLNCEATEEVCIMCEVHTPPDLREIEYRAVVHLTDGVVEYFDADNIEMAEELCSMAWRGDFMSTWLIESAYAQVNCSTHGWRAADLAGMCGACRAEEDSAELDAYEHVNAELTGLVDGSEYDLDRIPF